MDDIVFRYFDGRVKRVRDVFEGFTRLNENRLDGNVDQDQLFGIDESYYHPLISKFFLKLGVSATGLIENASSYREVDNIIISKLLSDVCYKGDIIKNLCGSYTNSIIYNDFLDKIASLYIDKYDARTDAIELAFDEYLESVRNVRINQDPARNKDVINTLKILNHPDIVNVILCLNYNFYPNPDDIDQRGYNPVIVPRISIHDPYSIPDQTFQLARILCFHFIKIIGGLKPPTFSEFKELINKYGYAVINFTKLMCMFRQPFNPNCITFDIRNISIIDKINYMYEWRKYGYISFHIEGLKSTGSIDIIEAYTNARITTINKVNQISRDAWEPVRRERDIAEREHHAAIIRLEGYINQDIPLTPPRRQ